VNPTLVRTWRIATELLAIAVTVAAIVTTVTYTLAAPGFDDPYRGENAWRNFVTASIVLSALGAAAAGVLWLTWRQQAAVDAQPDGPARFLAVAVATLPEVRRCWGAAMVAELSSVTDSTARWRFAVSSARGALFPPADIRHPATGRIGAAVAVLGVVASMIAAAYLSLAYPGAADASSVLFIAVLMVFLAACIYLALFAPPALTSSSLASRTGICLGLGSGLGLLLFSRTNVLDAGAMTFIVPAQFLTFVIAPVIVACVARSLGAAVQTIVAGFLFSGVMMFPVYILESIRRYHAGGGLYLDGDAPRGTTIGTNLGDAISWLLLIVPSLMIPLGILGAALATVVTGAIVRAVRRTSSDEAAADSAGNTS
jgi:hypothetical protein